MNWYRWAHRWALFSFGFIAGANMVEGHYWTAALQLLAAILVNLAVAGR